MEFDIEMLCAPWYLFDSERLLKFYTEEFVHNNFYSLRKTNYAVLILEILFTDRDNVFKKSFELVNPDEEDAWHLAIELHDIIYGL